MKRPSALFLDIDGTILKSDHSLSPRVARAITDLRQAGTMVCLATGRSWEALEPLYKQLKLDGPTVCYNGAFLVAGPEGNTLEEMDMDEEAARYAISIAREKNLELIAYRHTELLFEDRGEHIKAYNARTGLDGRLVNFDTFDSLEFTKAIIISEPQRLAPVKELLESVLGPEKLSATYSDPTFLELLGPGVDKGKGLKEVCRLRGIDVADSVAMGDGWNDLALLQAAGDAWVMGGAPDDLKSLFPADRQAPHADSDGAALVMEAMAGERDPDFSLASAGEGAAGE